jgi:hypothetical protein
MAKSWDELTLEDRRAKVLKVQDQLCEFLNDINDLAVTIVLSSPYHCDFAGNVEPKSIPDFLRSQAAYLEGEHESSLEFWEKRFKKR